MIFFNCTFILLLSTEEPGRNRGKDHSSIHSFVKLVKKCQEKKMWGGGKHQATILNTTCNSTTLFKHSPFPKYCESPESGLSNSGINEEKILCNLLVILSIQQKLKCSFGSKV